MARIFIEIEDEIVELNPDYEMEDIVRWANSDYTKED